MAVKKLIDQGSSYSKVEFEDQLIPEKDEKIERKIPDEKIGTIYKHLRNIGMVIYCSHLLINALTSLAVSAIDRHYGIGLVRYQFILSFSFTLLLAVITNWLSHKDRFKGINWVLA